MSGRRQQLQGADNALAQHSYWYDASANVVTEIVQIGSVTNVALQSTYDRNGDRLTLSADAGTTVNADGTLGTNGIFDFRCPRSSLPNP